MMVKKQYLLGMILALVLWPLAVQASMDPAVAGKRAETMIRTLGDEAIAAIEETQGDDIARRKAFSVLLDKNFDTAAIARFALGRYWSTATNAEQKRYTALFDKMIVDVYTARFSEYSGQKLDVIGNKPAGRADVIVNSRIVSADGTGQPIKVDWRVRKGKVIDVIVEGVSMSVTQRSEFAAIIQRNGGAVASLITHLEK